MRKNYIIFLAAFLLLSPAGFAETAENTSSGSPLDFANGLYARKMYGPAISEYEKFILAYPNSPEVASARFRSADSHYFAKNYKSSIYYFNSFVTKFPKDKRVPMARFRIATAHYYLRHFAPAMRIFLELSKSTDDNNVRAGSLLYRGRMQSFHHQPEKALALYNEILAKHADTEYAVYASVAAGDAYLSEKKLDEAQKSYETAAAKDNPVELAYEARFRIAEIYFSRSDYDKAAGYYAKVFQVGDGAESLKPLRMKALTGLFYCDFYKKDLPSFETRMNAQEGLLAQSADEPEVRYLWAVLLADQKNTAKAVEIFDKTLSNPKTTAALQEKIIFKKSQVLSGAGQAEEAIAELQKMFGRNSKSGEARATFEKAKALKDLGRFSEAASSLEDVLSRYPDSEYGKAATYDLGGIYLKIGNTEKSRKNFETYVSKYASDPLAEKALLELIQMDLEAKEFKSAAEKSDKFIQSYPKSGLLDIAYYKSGVALTGAKDYDKAAKQFKFVAEAFPLSTLIPSAYYGYAASLEGAGHIDEAVAAYEKILKDYPDHPYYKEATQRLGHLYLDAGKFEKVSQFYEDQLFNKPNVPSRSEIAFWLVRYFLDNRKYAEMQRVLAMIPARFPEEHHEHEISFFTAESFMGLKDYDKAIEFYSKAMETKDGEYVSHATLGKGIALAAKGDYKGAGTLFDEALKYDDDAKISMRARFETANLKVRAGSLEEAAKLFMMVAILYDDAKYCPLSLYKAGQCFTRVGKQDDAQKAFDELMNRYPDSEWAKHIQHERQKQ